VDISRDYFELFGIPKQFSVDLNSIASRYRELQSEIHPDRFAHASERDKRLSVQYSTYINEAYECLRTPLSRAIYLLQQLAPEYDVDSSNTHDPAFLMEQMELREDLASIKDRPDPEAMLDKLLSGVDEHFNQLQEAFEKALSANELSSATDLVGKMQFVFKLRKECEAVEADLFDY